MSNAESPDAQASTPAPPAARRHEPSGIGGWLILPLAHLAITMGRILFGLGSGAADGLRVGGPGIGAAFDNVPAAVAALGAAEQWALGFAVYAFAVAVYAGFCLVQFLRKKRVVPDLMIGFYLALGAMMVANYILLANFPRLWETADAMTDAFLGVIRAAIAMTIGIPYFIVSKRVRNTFVR
jgi:hypothetical protein